jgi:plasmid stability protein
MDTYDSVKNGYNIRIKADSSLGFPNKYKGLKRPLEIGLKISAAKMGHIVSEETRDIYRKMYAGKRVMPIGYTHDEKTRQKFAQSLKGNQNAKGHKVSDELKKYYSDLFKGEKSAKFGTHVTHCPQGHVMSGENLVIRPNGIRRCHACLLKQGAKHRAAHKARKEAKNGTQQR